MNGTRRVVRIHVEPIEVELDDDGAILITALQSALPGASGLYFRDIDECKASVTFDGKKLLPPNDGWKDRKYFASLGCRPFDYPFGSYANATKQFERAVSVVQRLLGTTKCVDYALLEKEIHTKRRSMQRSPPLNVAATVKSENMHQLLTALTQKQAPTEVLGDTPLEQQFVDLARISTAKDVIIEQQRTDIKNCTELLDGKERGVKHLQECYDQLEKRCRLQENEIATLRNLNREQGFMSEKVNELMQKLAERNNELAAQKTEIEFLVKKVAKLDCGREKAQKISDLGTSVESTADTTEQFDSIKSISERDTSDLNNAELVEALTYAKARIEKLENDANVAGEKYEQLKEVYMAVVADKNRMETRSQREGATNILIKKEPPDDLLPPVAEDSAWNVERLDDLRKELAASEKRIAELTRMVHVLTNSSATPELRLAEVLASRYDCKRCTDRNDTKIQITVTK